MASVIKTELLFRQAEFDRQAIDLQKRTAPLSFSSETPVLRSFGWEILDHSPMAVNMSRARLPLLMDHNKSMQVGKVDISLAGKRGIGTAKFSKDASNIMEDVAEDIRGDTSVGYTVQEMKQEGERDGVPVYRVSKWTPLEISLVSIPADGTVGIGRSLSVDEQAFETRIEEFTKDKNMPDNIPTVPLTPTPAPAPAPAPTIDARQGDGVPSFLISDRVREIREAANAYKDVKGMAELARHAEFAGWPFEKFRQEALQLFPKPEAIRQTPALDIKPRDLQKYSLSRAILASCREGGLRDGLERELSDEIQMRHNKAADGFWLPMEVLGANMQRSYVAGTGTLGGFMVQTTNEGNQFIEVLRNKAQVMALGARSLMLSTPVTIPRRAAAGNTNWVGETVAATLGVGNFEQITLTPKGISAYQQYAKQLLITNDPSIDNLVRDDITAIIGLAIDLAAIHGTGTTQPLGIIGTTGIGSVLLATNGLALNNATAYPAMVSLETLVSSANADVGALAYLMRPSTRGALRVAQRFASTDSPVWTNGGPFPAGIGAGLGNGNNDGVVNGYRAAVSSQVANNLTTGTATTITSPIFFGNWNELLIGHFNGGATDIVVDPYTAGANAVIRIYARHWTDVGVRHGASFAVLGGILGV